MNGREFVYEFSAQDNEPQQIHWLIRDGFMKHVRDVEGMLKFLRTIGVAGSQDRLSIN